MKQGHKGPQIIKTIRIYMTKKYIRLMIPLVSLIIQVMSEPSESNSAINQGPMSLVCITTEQNNRRSYRVYSS